MKTTMPDVDRSPAQRHLVEATRVLASSLDLPQALERFAAIALDLMGADLVSIWLTEAGGRRLTLGAQAGVLRADLNLAHAPERDEGLRAWYEAQGFPSFLGVPVLVNGTAVGVMACLTRSPRAWSADDVEDGEAIATTAAVAIRNARLLGETQSQTAALREKNAELDSFVYTVSHDLKAPLVTIQGMSGLVLEEYAGQLDEDGRHYLERIAANTQQMERLILDLLALSRCGREAHAPEDVPLGELVGDIAADLAEPLQAKGITLTVGELPAVRAIRVQMEQVMRNLLTNAIKYMGDAPSPSIEVGAIARGTELEIWVRDNGIGIDPEHHDKIFEIFQRLKDVEAEGTGVGLPIVKKIVHAAGGRIWVESARGQGSTFRFAWPGGPRRS